MCVGRLSVIVQNTLGRLALELAQQENGGAVVDKTLDFSGFRLLNIVRKP